MSLSRRSGPTDARGSGGTVPPEAGYWKGLPDLLAFMSVSSWPDGSSRLPGTLIVFAENGAWKACLSDKDASLVCFVTGRTLDELLERCEGIVAGEGGDWRPARSPGRKKA